MHLRKPFLIALLLAGAGCAHQPAPAAYGGTLTLAVGESASFDDGLSLRLDRIEDSRCRQGVQCVWAGELAPVLALSGGDIGKAALELRLGTGTAPARQQGRYRFVLRQATADTATLMVTRP